MEEITYIIRIDMTIAKNVIIFAFKNTNAERVARGLSTLFEVIYLDSSVKSVKDFVNDINLSRYQYIIGLGDYSGRDTDQLRVETKCNNQFRNNKTTLECINIPHFIKQDEYVKYANGIGNSWCNLVSYMLLKNNPEIRKYTFVHIPKKFPINIAVNNLRRQLVGLLMSRIDEFEATQHLAKCLSCTTGQTYRAIQENEQDSDTDTYVIEPSGKRIPIQNTTTEGDVLKNCSNNKRAFGKGESFIASLVNHEKWIFDVITKKENMYADPSNIILVIRGSMPTASPNEILTYRPLESKFAGIYYVSVPNSNPESGYIVTFKKYWDVDDIFYSKKLSC